MSKIDNLLAELEKRCNRIRERLKLTGVMETSYFFALGTLKAYRGIIDLITFTPETSADAKTAAEDYSNTHIEDVYFRYDIVDAFVAGAKWQAEQSEKEGKL